MTFATAPADKPRDNSIAAIESMIYREIKPMDWKRQRDLAERAEAKRMEEYRKEIEAQRAESEQQQLEELGKTLDMPEIPPKDYSLSDGKPDLNYRNHFDRPNRLIALCCKAMGCTVEELQSKSRKMRIVMKRQITMTVILTQTSISYPKVGEKFDRDHSTIIHAKNKVLYDEHYKAQYEDVLKRVLQMEREIYGPEKVKNCTVDDIRLTMMPSGMWSAVNPLNGQTLARFPDKAGIMGWLEERLAFEWTEQ